MSTQWNDHMLDDILSDVQRMTRERDASESGAAEPILPQHGWTLAEVDQLLGLDDALFGVPKRENVGDDLTLPAAAHEPPTQIFETVKPAPEPPTQVFETVKPVPEPPTQIFETVKPESEPVSAEAQVFEAVKPEPEPVSAQTQVFEAVKPEGGPEPAEAQVFEAVKPEPEPAPAETQVFKAVKPGSAEPQNLRPVYPEAEPLPAPPTKTRSARAPALKPDGKTKVLGKLVPHDKRHGTKPAAQRHDAPEMVDGQMMLQGFETEEPVQQVDEAEAEQELKVRRKAQIKDFKLYDLAQKYEPDLPPKADIFDPQPEPGAVDADEKNDADEYVRLSDRMRIGRLLQEDRRKAFLSLCALLVLSIASVIISAIAGNAAGESRQVLFAVNLVLLSLAVAASISSIYSGLQDLLHLRPTCSSAAFVTAAAALIQGVVAFIAPGTEQISSTFCAPAVCALCLCKFAALFEAIGVLSNFKFCAFTAAEQLYTVRDFEFAADAFAVGKSLEQSHPRLRYAQRTHFPTGFRAHSVFRSQIDRLCRFILPAAFVAAIIMTVTGWIVSKNVPGSLNGFAGAMKAFAGALCVAMPSGAALTVSIPAVMLMRSLNRRGGMLSSPEAAAAHAGLSAVAMDSTELYDPKHTEIFCYQDYGAIRIDDVFLYAAALAVGAHSPAESAFLHTVGNPDILPPVRSLIYEERLGVSAYIRNQSVLLGSRNLLSNHSIDPPPKSAEVPYLQEGKRILYLAVGSKVCAMFVMDYVPKRTLSAPLRTLQDNDTRLLMYAPDCNVTEDFAAAGFGLKKGDVQLISPAAGELLRKRCAEETENAPAAALHNGSAEGFLYTLAAAAVIRNIQRIAAFIAAIGCGIGWLVSFILLLVKGVATLNWVFALLYPALWIAASLALGIAQAHKATHP